MSSRVRVLARAWLCSAALLGLAPAAQAGLITQSANLPLTATDFTANGQVTGNPLSFTQFDTKNNTLQLDSVTLTINAAIENRYGMGFTTPATITNYSYNINDPSKTGPSITIYQPDAKTPLIIASAPNDPAILSRSVTYGGKPGQTLPATFSSDLPTSSPFYLAPATYQANQTLSLTSPADLALFTGNSKIMLPVAASAWSSFMSSSGNGWGSVQTRGTANVTVTYNFHEKIPAPQTVPEPGAMLLWGLGGLTVALGARVRRSRG